MQKIAITGPESTGKSTLSAQLAQHYDTVYVPEYARMYMDQLDRTYTQADILRIAQKQVAMEQEFLSEARHLLISDTELLVTKIWSEHAFGNCPDWILENLEKQDYDLYLLMDIDLPWEPDPQREHPHLRQYFFDLYQQSLENLKAPYVIISGNAQERLQNAIQAINERLTL